MPRAQIEVAADERPVLPVRVSLDADIEFCARAMAVEFGRPGRRVGKHHVRPAVSALASRLIRQEYVPDVPEDVIESWCRYLVRDVGLFPESALRWPGQQ